MGLRAPVTVLWVGNVGSAVNASVACVWSSCAVRLRGCGSQVHAMVVSGIHLYLTSEL